MLERYDDGPAASESTSMICRWAGGLQLQNNNCSKLVEQARQNPSDDTQPHSQLHPNEL